MIPLFNGEAIPHGSVGLSLLGMEDSNKAFGGEDTRSRLFFQDDAPAANGGQERAIDSNLICEEETQSRPLVAQGEDSLMIPDTKSLCAMFATGWDDPQPPTEHEGHIIIEKGHQQIAPSPPFSSTQPHAHNSMGGRDSAPAARTYFIPEGVFSYYGKTLRTSTSNTVQQAAAGAAAVGAQTGEFVQKMTGTFLQQTGSFAAHGQS